MGSFYGYRRYDTAGYKVKYPFGHGLSYATFKYYGLKIANDQISFYIKNVSRLSGAEAVQIYVGVQKSAIIRPKKELKAFFKVNLSAGKKVRVTIPLSSLDLNTFYNEEGAFVKERGKYVVYVCSSASDERLKGSFVSGLKTLKPDGEKYSSYFQTVGNIKDGGYTLEETVKLSKISQKPMFGVSLGFLLAFVFVDLAYLYFADIGWIFDNTWIFIVLMAITAIPAIFAVIFKIKINREIGKSMLNSKKLKEDKRKSIAEEDLNDEINYVELFEEEFAVPVIEAADEDSEQEIQESKTETFDFDADITFARATDELFELCKAKGITIDRKSLRSLFAGFASSRLIILKSDAKDLIAPFLETLSEYFGCGNSVIDCKPVQTEEQEVVKEDVVAKENEQPSKETQEDVAATDSETVEEPVTESEETAVDGEQVEQDAEDVAATDSEAVEEPSEEPVAESEKTEQAIEEPVVEEERQVEDVSESEIKEEKRSVSENVAINIYNGSQSHENDVNVLSLTNIGAEEIQTVMTKFLRYFDRPDCTVKIDVPEEYGETSIKVPENFWFILTLAEGQKVSELPKNILETASVAELSAKAARNASDNEEASFAHISYYQFTTMAERAARDYSIDENSWKRLDNFESKINAKDDSFHISNKQWQHFEKHAAVYLATGGEQTEALDNIISSHVVYLTIPILANARANEKLSYVLEESFGEGNVPQCLQAIKTDSIK